MAIIFPGGTQNGPAVVNQVKNVVKTSTFDTTSSNWVNVTGLEVTIQPSSTAKKILVSTSVVISGETYGRRFTMRLLRTDGANTVELQRGDAAGSRTRGSYSASTYGSGNGGAFTAHQMVLDNPGSTSTLTYRVSIVANDGGEVRINYTNNDADNSSHGRSASSITVMEVDV